MVGTTVWFCQPHWGFRLYYALPLILYFILESIHKKQFLYLALAVLTFGITAIYGMGLYIGFFQLFFCTIFFISAFFISRSSFSILLPKTKKDFALLGLLFFTVLIPVLYLFHTDLLTILSPGRDASGKVDYMTFLNYGGDAGEFKFFSGFAHGLYELLDTPIYGGFLIPVFTLIGLIFYRNKNIIPFLISGITLFFFSLGSGTFLAPLLYFVPGLNSVRHIAYTTTILKMVIIFVAGFGFETFIKIYLEETTHKKSLLKIFRGVLFLFLIIFFVPKNKVVTDPRGMLVIFLTISTLIALYAAELKNSENMKKPFFYLLLLIVAVDVTSYRSDAFHKIATHVKKETWDLFQLKPIAYIPSRKINYFDNKNFSLIYPYFMPKVPKDSKGFIDILNSKELEFPQPEKNRGQIYNNLEQILGFDPCISIFRSDNAISRVAKLYRQYNLTNSENFSLKPLSRLLKDKDPTSLYTSVGCESDKLKLFTSDTAETSFSKPKTIPYEVTSFDQSHLSLKVEGSSKEKFSWLYYADSWHPFWKAYVNGKEEPIILAREAFKAVKIPPGNSVIDFVFYSKWNVIFILFMWLEITFLTLYFWIWSIKKLLIPSKEPLL
jgi:hypothetical protein